MTPPPKRGRPAAGDAALTHAIMVRLTPGERAAWERAAMAEGVPLARWVRERVAKAIGWRLPVRPTEGE